MKRRKSWRLLAALGAGVAAGGCTALDNGARTAGRTLDPDIAIAAVLDDFHAAASEADAERYLGHLAVDGVFIGTDATERWSRDAFAAFVAPYFDAGRGWTYVPRDRFVTVGAARDVAWFEEILDSPKYGTCRGTGCLVRTRGGWRIAQYALTFPIPNDVSLDVVEIVSAHEESAETPAERDDR